MKYLIDTNSLSDSAILSAKQRDNLYIIEETLDEWAPTERSRRKVKSSGINILSLGRKHYERLKKVMEVHANNISLIRLFNCEGAADVLMLAYALSDRDDSPRFFEEEWIFVTRDLALIEVAKSYGFKSVSQI